MIHQLMKENDVFKSKIGKMKNQQTAFTHWRAYRVSSRDSSSHHQQERQNNDDFQKSDEEYDGASMERGQQQHRRTTTFQREEKALRVAVIGCPNVGKSALANALVRAPVCPVSRCVDTTRKNSTVAITEDRVQLEVVDSPGLIGLRHAKKFVGTHSDDPILGDPERAVGRADNLLVVHDSTANGRYLNHRVLHLLHRYEHVPAALVLNKIDLVERRTDLLELADTLTEGLVAGQPPNVKPVRMGMLTCLLERDEKRRMKKNKSSSPFPEDFSVLHPKLSVRAPPRDTKWHAIYNKLLQKPVHKCAWSDTRRLFDGQFGWPRFQAVFFVSALSEEGVAPLRQYLLERAQPTVSAAGVNPAHPRRRWRFAPGIATNQSIIELCRAHVRGALLDYCPADIAYQLRPTIIEFEERQHGKTGIILHDGFFDESANTPVLNIVAEVNCNLERWARVVQRQVVRIEKSVSDRIRPLFVAGGTLSGIEFRLYVKHGGKLFLPSDTGDSVPPL